MTVDRDRDVALKLPVLSPEQRRAFPILAAVLDCYRKPMPGEAVIYLGQKKRRPRGEALEKREGRSKSPADIKRAKVQVLPDGRVDAKNAAAFLGLSEKTLATMRCNGTGPTFTKRGRIFYFVQDLEGWIKGGEARSTSQARFLQRTGVDHRDR